MPSKAYLGILAGAALVVGGESLILNNDLEAQLSLSAFRRLRRLPPRNPTPACDRALFESRVRAVTGENSPAISPARNYQNFHPHGRYGNYERKVCTLSGSDRLYHRGGAETVYIPGGDFWMRSAEPNFRDAEPWHRVRLSGFWIPITMTSQMHSWKISQLVQSCLLLLHLRCRWGAITDGGVTLRARVGDIRMAP
jgi:hypothetical protein